MIEIPNLKVLNIRLCTNENVINEQNLVDVIVLVQQMLQKKSIVKLIIDNELSVEILDTIYNEVSTNMNINYKPFCQQRNLEFTKNRPY